MATPVEEISNPFGDANAYDIVSATRHSVGSGDLISSPVGDGSGSGSKSVNPRKKRVGFSGDTGSGERSPQINGLSQPFSDGALSPRFSLNKVPLPVDADQVSPSPNALARTVSVDIPLTSHSDTKPSDGVSKSEISAQQTEQIHQALRQNLAAPRPARPAIRRTESKERALDDSMIDDLEGPDNDGSRAHRQMRAREAFERGKRLERDERSAPTSRYTSPDRSRAATGSRKLRVETPTQHSRGTSLDLKELHEKLNQIAEDDVDSAASSPKSTSKRKLNQEAFKLVKRHSEAMAVLTEDPTPGLRSGYVTPTEEQEFVEDYQPQPQRYRGGILGSLLKLYGQQTPGHTLHSHPGHHRGHSIGDQTLSGFSTPQNSPPESGVATPSSSRFWSGSRLKNQSSASLLPYPSHSAGSISPSLAEELSQRIKEGESITPDVEKRPGLGKRNKSSAALAALNRLSRPRLADEIRITVHIAETISRQKYLMKLCKALMLYGAPTHRLEEYMRMSARVLETDAQFLYIPGAMIMSFDDASTHTTEVKLVKVQHGVDLGKLRDVHEVYKEVVHDHIGVEEATARLKEINNKAPKHGRLFRIFVYGLASACVGPFAFQARLIDLPIAFFLGCILGVLQLVVAPRSDLYANVFEIAATVITSFLARAFGSIRGGDLFCFSALAQSSIALILPGYTVLCASLELQSRSIVAGSVRMVYAIIYSLFIGFGITIGTAIYGIIDRDATSKVTCANPIPNYWYFFFVPAYTMCLIIINQAKWKQAPIMIIVAFGGYVVSTFSAARFQGNTQVSNALSALAIGVMANLWSRLGGRLENFCLDLWEDTLRPRYKLIRNRLRRLRGRAAPKSKPKPKQAPPVLSLKTLEAGEVVFPSSAPSDSPTPNDKPAAATPTTGADTANTGSSRAPSIVTADNESTFVRGRRAVGYSLAAAAMLPAIFVQVPSGLSVGGSLVSGIDSANQITGNATNGSTVVNVTSIATNDSNINSIALNVGYSVVQVAIGITVGLFLSAIVVYPLGKRRSGLFSF